MKTKRFEKKLSLNKKTVSNLSNVEMIDVKGGATQNVCTNPCNTKNQCETLPITLCPTSPIVCYETDTPCP